MAEQGVDISPKQDGGVLKQILRAGEGEAVPVKGNEVTVHYVGTLEDGTEFDSSRSRQETFKFTLGKGSVIKAWDIGVATMKKGELARLTCKPEYAYGEAGSPPKIPPNATLIFEVELLDWKGEDLSKDGGVIKHLIKEGEKWVTPNDGATVNIRYKAFYNGAEFESREVSFIQGDGDEVGIVKGVEIATKKMKKNEICRLDVAAKYAYGTAGCPEKNIPPNANLVYEVEMISFEKAKEKWELDSKQKLEQSKIFKEKGTGYFKNGNYSKAVRYYKQVISYLEYETSLTGEEKEERDALILSSHLNLAMCHLKLKEYSEAEEACKKALEMDSKNVKALFRRGQARLERNEYELALEDFEKVVELEPDNKAAKNQILLCKQRKKQFLEREKKLYSNMFQKLLSSKSNKDSANQVTEVGEWNNDMAKGMMPLQEEKAAFEEGLLKEIGDSMEIGHGDKNGGDNNPEVVQQMECN
ncbi:hypothetical protein C0Q70_04737 [Pomacea canaliculata]|uniref:peptidylprolyl isomerase n=1 Tax=Pomacea canaliculata TaxID=400727 RepID=A0A2T7PJ74_POMCA|nr:peptidyl-prolyl cis-trans isomerase FKBP4-like [Pomacea canaliculata]PVD33481.1 hypothetical protein C0Q70_04737 [Pomacea canaliculata]